MFLKPRLTDIVLELFEVGFNHDPKHDKAIKEKLVDFLKEEDNILALDSDVNVRLARDAAHFAIADRIYAETTNSKEAYHYMESFLKRMMETAPADWHYYDLKIVISSIHFTKDVEQAIVLAKKADERIIGFQIARLTHNLEGALAANMCARVLNAKYCDDEVIADLTDQFESWMIRLENLIDSHKDSEFLEMALHITKIRRDIFNNKSSIITYCDDLLPQFDKSIAKMVQNEVKFYYSLGALD